MKEQLKSMDIYLIDQILKGRFDQIEKVVDLGCGSGRNLPYFLKKGIDVYGVDPKWEAIAEAKARAKYWNPKANLDQFIIGTMEENELPSHSFDLVICNAVLHFAESRTHFEKMLFGACRLLKPNGFFFARLASDIGIEEKVIPLGNGRYRLPDESERFLVNQDILLEYTSQLNAKLAEFIKTTNVQNLRCMTTWCFTL